MADDMTLGEVARRIDALSVDVRQLIGRPEYQARNESVDRQLAELASDMKTLTNTIDQVAKSVDQRFRDMERHKSNARLALVTSFVLPLVLSFIMMFFKSQGLSP